jgi:hypothetical protein
MCSTWYLVEKKGGGNVFFFSVVGWMYLLSPVSVDMTMEPRDSLSVINAHRRDAMICFIESTHSYGVDYEALEQMLKAPPAEAKVKVVPIVPEQSIPKVSLADPLLPTTHITTVSESKAEAPVLHIPEASGIAVDVLPDRFDFTNHISVTGIIHRYFHDFDADTILDKMLRPDRKTPLKKQYRGKTKDQIKADWEANRVAASTAGTLMHRRIEHYLNQIPPDFEIPILCPSYEQFLTWAQAHGPVVDKIMRTEFLVSTDRDTRLNGSIDAVFLSRADPVQSVLYVRIFDWKRSKEIKRRNIWQCGKGICRDLEDCNFNHYALQLSLYQFILENYYSHWDFEGHVYEKLVVVDRQLLVCHPDQPAAMYIPMPDMSYYVKQMVEDRRREIRGEPLGLDSDHEDDEDAERYHKPPGGGGGRRVASSGVDFVL